MPDSNYPSLSPNVLQRLLTGTVIPAHPLALDEQRRLDERRQRALTRYYLAAGAGGLAVGVHTTQFEIRLPQYDYLEAVLRLAAEEVERATADRPVIKVAGIVGPTEQAVAEARLACRYGYHLGLLSMGGLQDWTEAALIERARAVAQIIPLFGFYLQPAVGGRRLSFDFWRQFVEIDNVYAIKVAAFDRYQTLDVVRAVCHSPRADEIALYTGNDDSIVADLLGEYAFDVDGRTVRKGFVGGLLGHWAFWTKRAVELLQEIRQWRGKEQVPAALLRRGHAVTDVNAAVFDPAHDFHGCISGINEVLRRQGLLANRLCLSPEERLSPGQPEEIDRVYRAYPDLNDDDFVRQHLREWL